MMAGDLYRRRRQLEEHNGNKWRNVIRFRSKAVRESRSGHGGRRSDGGRADGTGTTGTRYGREKEKETGCQDVQRRKHKRIKQEEGKGRDGRQIKE